MEKTEISEDSTPLSGPGGEYEVAKDLIDLVCYLNDGRLLVSQTHRNDPRVLGYEAKLKRIGRSVDVFPVGLEVIRSAYSRHGLNGKSDVDSSKMQKEASDLFKKAVDSNASDIHIRVSERGHTKIWFRIHGDLRFIEEHSYEYGYQMCSTIYMTMTDVSDPAFKPLDRQDARIADKTKIPSKIDGIRVATTPQVGGFVMFLRLLYDDTGSSDDLHSLGYSPSHVAAVNLMKARPTGINILAGPTGSGKSTTLQRTLRQIAKERDFKLNIITVEDPPEYPIIGAVQTAVSNAENEAERSAAFQKAISGAMRLDPDIIMIGEVRDGPSAQLAVRASITGHQVWTTVHANNAMLIVDRLIDLGVPLSLLADSNIVTGLICQRLVKVLCPHCKVPFNKKMDRISPDLKDRILRTTHSSNVYMQGDGCPHCHHTGTAGRTVLVELITPDPKFMEFIKRGDKVGAHDYWINDQGGKSMLHHAIEKINQGLVDPEAAENQVGPLTMDMLLADHRLDEREVQSVLAA